MAQRTQMRLHAITGSLSAINSGIADANVAPVGSSAALAENMLEAMGHIAGAIKRIHGDSDFLAGERGKFTHSTSQFIGVLSASSDIKGGAALDIAGNADIDGASDLHGAVHAFSTLDVDGAVNLNSTLDVDALATMSGSVVEDLAGGNGAVLFADAQGRLKSDAKLTWDGSKLSVDGALDLTGGIVGSSLVAGRVVYVDADGALTTEAGLDYDAAADVLGVSGSLEVGVEATLASAIVSDLTNGRVVLAGASGALVDDAQITHSAGQLTVSGSTFSKDVSIVRDLSVGRDLSAISGSFSGDLTVSGDLVVNGTTVTVNTTELLVEDNMVVINKNETGAGVTANTAGIEIERGSADNAFFQWLESADKFELKVGAAYADLKIDDLEAVDGTFSGDLTAVSGSFSGDVDVTGDLTVLNNGQIGGNLNVIGDVTANSLKINGDSPGNLYIVGAAGEIEDSIDLTWTSAKLEIQGAVSGSGNFEIGDSLYVHGYAEITNETTLKNSLYVFGAASLYSSLDVDGAVNLDSTLSVEGAVTLDGLGDQSILKVGGDLYMSASADLRLHGGQSMKFLDQYGVSAALNPGDWADAEGIKLSSNAQEWIDFQDTFGTGKSILGALVGGGAGGKFVEAVDYSGTIVSGSLLTGADGSSDFSVKWPTIVEPRVLKTDVFVNGQLMVSGSGMDYLVDGAGNVTFSFGLVPDDMVVVKVG